MEYQDNEKFLAAIENIRSYGLHVNTEGLPALFSNLDLYQQDRNNPEYPAYLVLRELGGRRFAPADGIDAPLSNDIATIVFEGYFSESNQTLSEIVTEITRITRNNFDCTILGETTYGEVEDVTIELNISGKTVSLTHEDVHQNGSLDEGFIKNQFFPALSGSIKKGCLLYHIENSLQLVWFENETASKKFKNDLSHFQNLTDLLKSPVRPKKEPRVQSDLISRNKLEQLLTQGFKEILEPHGFIQNPESGTLSRKTEHFEDRISFNHPTVRDGFFISIPLFSRHINLIDEYWSDWAPKLRIANSFLPTIYLYPALVKPEIKNDETYDPLHNGYRESMNTEGVKRFLDSAKKYIEDHLLPSADKFSDLKTLDKMVNMTARVSENAPHILNPEGIMFRKMIIAKLTGNPIYNEMCTLIRDLYSWYESQAIEGNSNWANYPEAHESLMQRLENVQPLVNNKPENYLRRIFKKFL
jgi:hypothetical protein